MFYDIFITMRFIITEEEKNHIKGLYEVDSKGFNLFTYKDIISNMINKMTSIMENKTTSQWCKNIDSEMTPVFGLVDDLLAKISADTKKEEGEAIQYLHDTWEDQKRLGLNLLLSLIGRNVSVASEMVEKLLTHLRTKKNGNLLAAMISDIFGKAKIQQVPACN